MTEKLYKITWDEFSNRVKILPLEKKHSKRYRSVFEGTYKECRQLTITISGAGAMGRMNRDIRGLT